MKWLRPILFAFVAWCVTIEIIEATAKILFGFQIDGDWFLLLAASSSKELVEFWNLYGASLSVGIAALVLSLAVAWWLIFRARGIARRIFFAFLILYVAWNCHTPNYFRHWSPIYFAFDTLRSAGEYAELIKAGEWPREGKDESVARPESWTNLIVVIGESMTTDRMSLYGYRKPTTPHLDAMKSYMTVFPPVRPNFPDTVRSMRMMFTRASVADPHHARETLPVALRRRGYHVAFISGQAKWARYCGFQQMLFAACNNCVYPLDGTGKYDEALVESLKTEISGHPDGPFAIFLQLNGSHFDPRTRVPRDFECPDDFDAYDRSIAYTDSVLGKIIASLPQNAVLVYMSDHGESPDSDNWRDLRSPSLWKVPFLIYPKNDSIKPIATLDETFYRLLEAVGIKDVAPGSSAAISSIHMLRNSAAPPSA